MRSVIASGIEDNWSNTLIDMKSKRMKRRRMRLVGQCLPFGWQASRPQAPRLRPSALALALARGKGVVTTTLAAHVLESACIPRASFCLLEVEAHALACGLENFSLVLAENGPRIFFKVALHDLLPCRLEWHWLS